MLPTVDPHVCRICLEPVEPAKDGQAGIKLNCVCADHVGTLHESCAIQWFSRSGSQLCDVCGDPVTNVLPFVPANDVRLVIPDVPAHLFVPTDPSNLHLFSTPAQIAIFIFVAIVTVVVTGSWVAVMASIQGVFTDTMVVIGTVQLLFLSFSNIYLGIRAHRMRADVLLQTVVIIATWFFLNTGCGAIFFYVFMTLKASSFYPLIWSSCFADIASFVISFYCCKPLFE